MSKSLIGGLRKVCFANPANGDRVIVSNISAITETPEEKITSDTPTGVSSGGHSYNYNISFFDAVGATEFEAWENADTPVIAVLLYENGVRYFLDPVPISGYLESNQMNARDGVSPFTVNMQIAYSDPYVYLSQNLLLGAVKRNADNKTQTALTTNFVPKVRISGTGTLQLNYLNNSIGNETGDALTIQFPFPFPGESFNASMDTNAGPSTFTVSSRLFNETVVNTSDFGTNGSANAFTVGASAYWLRVVIPADSLSNIYALLKATGNTKE